MKIQLLTIIALAIGLLFLITACSDQDDDQLEITAFVTLGWLGDLPIDICGFYVQIDNKTYIPVDTNNILDRFKGTRDTIVEMTYIDLGEDTVRLCGQGTQVVSPILEILDIE